MRLGISSWSYPWSIGVPGSSPVEPFGILDLTDRAIALQADVLQVADNLPLDGLARPAFEEFAARVRSAGIVVEVGTRGIQPDHVRRYLRITQALSSQILRVVVDSADHHPEPHEVIDLLQPHRPAFQEAGVVLAIENHDRFPAEVVAAIVRELGEDWAGVCLDTINSFGALEGPAVVVQTLAPLAVNLHVKDFIVTRHGSQMGFTVEGRPAGQGSLNVPWLFGELARYGRTDLTAVVELWTPPADSIEQTVAIEQRWVEESVTYLRPLVSAN